MIDATTPPSKKSATVNTISQGVAMISAISTIRALRPKRVPSTPGKRAGSIGRRHQGNRFSAPLMYLVAAHSPCRLAAAAGRWDFQWANVRQYASLNRIPRFSIPLTSLEIEVFSSPPPARPKSDLVRQLDGDLLWHEGSVA